MNNNKFDHIDFTLMYTFTIIIVVFALVAIIGYTLQAPAFLGDEPQYLYDAGIVQSILDIPHDTYISSSAPQYDGIARGPLNAVINALIFSTPHPATHLLNLLRNYNA